MLDTTYATPYFEGLGTKVLGKYPQTVDGELRKISWIVLKEEKGKALLISKYALDCRPYHEGNDMASWKRSSLRAFLNTDFFETAFSPKERAKIMLTPLDNRNEYYRTCSENTKDYIFLLSRQDVEELFPEDDMRKCAPTHFAKEQGAWASDDILCLEDGAGGTATCCWWLRTPGLAGYVSCDYVDSCGDASQGSYDANADDCGVRPALYYSLHDEKGNNAGKDGTDNESEAWIEYNRDEPDMDDVPNFNGLDTITFGRYPQTADGEPLEINWIILKKENGKALLLSKYVLECSDEDPNTFLNEEFYEKAFSREEKAKIWPKTMGSNGTEDNDAPEDGEDLCHVFLLSVKDAEELFPGDDERRCLPTAYAIERGTWVSNAEDCDVIYQTDGEAACWWRLGGSDEEARVLVDGSVGSGGYCVDFTSGGLRPAIWIDLQS